MRALALTVAALCGCAPHDTGPAEPPPFRHHALLGALDEQARAFTFADGDWKEDFGDAALYGLATYARRSERDPLVDERTTESAARAAQVVAEANLITGDVNDLLLSALGQLEYMDATGDRSALDDVAALVADMDALVAAMGFRIDPDAIDSWAIDVYGPTAVAAGIGLLNLQYAALTGQDASGPEVVWTEHLERSLYEESWTGTAFGMGDARTDLYLYPNAMMIALEAKLYQANGAERHKERALSAWRAIQALRISERPLRYRSPYSAVSMGAATDDYATLSSQNYLMIAALELYRITGDPAYVRTVDGILDGLSDTWGAWCLTDFHHGSCGCAAEEACAEGVCLPDTCHSGILHHWMDGAPAQPEHREFFCAGCNLQTLYVLWARQEQLDP